MMTNSGYPLEWFAEPIDAYLVCGICGNVLKDPRATACGHVFCRKCIHAWIDEYGVCPARCGEVEVEALHRASHIDKQISCLITSCKYTKVGCKAILKLADKELHELTCHYSKKLSIFGKTRSFSIFNFSLYQPEVASHSKSKNRHHLLSGIVSESEKDKRSTAQRSKLVKQRKSNSSFGFGGLKLSGLTKKSPSVVAINKPITVPKPMRMQSQHTYRLKRTKPRESLGLVLGSGEKTPDGTPTSFYVKGVNKDSLAWKAGLKPGDRIVQVDYYNLTAIPPQEAVARIKDKQLVTLTILRGLVPPSKQTEVSQDHIYDEIMYADQQLSQNLSQQDDFSQFITTGILREDFPTGSHRPRAGQVSERDLLKTKQRAFSSSEPQHIEYPIVSSSTTHPGEKGSKDSGLSSGSSNSPEHQKDKMRMFKEQEEVVEFTEDVPFERLSNLRQSYRTEKEMLKNFLKSRKKEESDNVFVGTSKADTRSNCRIEGEYEVEDIYLQKNGTSQLGVTLGYDTKTAKGYLYVCEILPTGLAYQDGRLKCGDIIRRVNGFEVHDPEEAILLFLEQDQDITLSVARKIKAVSNRLILSNQSTIQPTVEHTYAVLEEKVNGNNTPLRRIDSCGSLDSRSHKYAQGHNKVAQLEDSNKHAQKVPVTTQLETDTEHTPMTASMIKVNEAGYEYMCSSNRRSSNESPHQLTISSSSRSTSRSPPRNLSPLCYSAGQGPRATSPHSQHLQCTPTQSAPLPLRRTPSPEAYHRMRPRFPSQEYLAHVAVSRQPKNLVADNRHRINRVNYEHKIISPTTSGEGIKKAVSFRTVNQVKTCKIATRCDSDDFVIHRSESLV